MKIMIPQSKKARLKDVLFFCVNYLFKIIHMKLIIDKILTLFLFIVSIWCFYATFTMVFASTFINFVLFFVAIFFLIQGCGMFDKIQGYGQYSDETVNENEIMPADGGTSMEQNGDEDYESNDSSCNENDDYNIYD